MDGVGTDAARGPLERGRQIGVGEGLAGDAFGVEVVGLALAAVAGLLGGAGRADVSHIVTGFTEEHRGVAAQN